jgi:hypothetical protein
MVSFDLLLFNHLYNLAVSLTLTIRHGLSINGTLSRKYSVFASRPSHEPRSVESVT